ncbi:MAG: hydroxysqualene dehydroxylase HpnE [Bacteroidetes bacterium]|nr:hydroxysqualene dehydroxylase HpnE [Bacteroidota bacterium]
MKKKVIIIGAGIAGISSAIELAQKGVEVTVIERRAISGGRMYSFRDNDTGELIDNGQHVMAGAYENFFNILKTLNTLHLVEFQKSLKIPFIDKDGNHSHLDSSAFPGKAGFIYGLLKFSGVSFNSKIATIKLIGNILNDKVETNDLTVSQLLNVNNISKDISERFWVPLCLAVMNLNINDAAALLLANVLKRLFQKGKASGLVFSKVPLTDLILPFENWLLNNDGNVRYKSSVIKLQIEDNKISVLLDNNEVLSADAVISAIPYHSFMKILPDKYNDYLFFKTLKDYKSSSIISMYLWLDKNLSNANFTGMFGTKTQWVFNRRKICESEKTINEKYPGHLTLTISGANDILDIEKENLVNECFNEVKTAFKSDAKLLAWKVIKEKKATFIANPDMEEKRLSQQSPIENLFIAGDWTATGLPATLEGAAFSGVLAADNVIDYFEENKNDNPTTI